MERWQSWVYGRHWECRRRHPWESVGNSNRQRGQRMLDQTPLWLLLPTHWHPLLVRRGSGAFCNPLIDFQLLFRGVQFQFIVSSRTGKEFVCASASSGDDWGDDEGPDEDGVAEVGIAEGGDGESERGRERERESLVSHPKTIMKDARSQSSERTHRRHVGTLHAPLPRPRPADRARWCCYVLRPSPVGLGGRMQYAVVC